LIDPYLKLHFNLREFYRIDIGTYFINLEDHKFSQIRYLELQLSVFDYSMGAV